MKTIETTILVTPDGTVTLQGPADIPPGEHRIVVVINEQPIMQGKQPPLTHNTSDFARCSAFITVVPLESVT